MSVVQVTEWAGIVTIRAELEHHPFIYSMPLDECHVFLRKIREGLLLAETEGGMVILNDLKVSREALEQIFFKSREVLHDRVTRAAIRLVRGVTLVDNNVQIPYDDFDFLRTQLENLSGLQFGPPDIRKMVLFSEETYNIRSQ